MLVNYLVLSKSRIAYILLFTIFFVAFTGLSPFAEETIFESDYTETGGGSLARQLIFVLVFVFAYICSKNFNVRKLLTDFPPIKYLLIFCIVSCIWSQSPGISFRRSILLTISTLSVYLIISRLGPERTLRALAITFSVLISASFISCFFVPGALHSSSTLFDTGLEGNWRGIFVHKNIAGAASAITIFLCIYQYMRYREKIWMVVFVTSIFFLILTSSKTSIGFVGPALFFGYLFSRVYNMKITSYLVVSVIFLFCILFLLFHEYIFSALKEVVSDPESFTGRGSIWSIVLDVIADYFWLGLGYGAAWAVGNDMVIPQYAFGYVDWVFKITEGHNGFFDTVLTIGIVGFSIFFLVYIVIPLLIILSNPHHFNKNEIFIICSSYFFFVFQNCLEATYLNSSSGLWVYCIFIYFIIYSKLSASK